MKIFGNKNRESKTETLFRTDFKHLSDRDIYLDSACQTPRPQPVMDSIVEYFQEYNACGGRVKYEWGNKVDSSVNDVRDKVLSFLGKSSKEYFVSFTLNTTYGINLILSQIKSGIYKQIITSEIEHNSVLLPTISIAKRLSIPRKILQREDDGSLKYKEEDTKEAIVVLNSTSNFDGRNLANAKYIARDVHKQNGILIIDGAQSIGHDVSAFKDVDFDAICFSGHKMYGPSIGVIVAKKKLVDSLNFSFVGGGMIEKLDESSFSLISGDYSSRLEAGLQDFAGIIGLGVSIDWLNSYKPEGLNQKNHQQKLAEMVFKEVSSLPNVNVLNTKPSSTTSFYSEDIDSHRLATFLSQQNIMTRSGYFCCHYFLQNVKKYPPLLRVSIGLHNTEEDIRKFISY